MELRLKRRAFLQTSLMSAGGIAVAHSRSYSATELTHRFRDLPEPKRGALRNDGLVIPNALKPGMTIGITAPASGTSKADLESGKAYLEGKGYNVQFGKCLLKRSGYLSAPDDERAREFMDFVESDSVDAIMCARGGYGVMRILPKLDFNSIRANAKPVIGYSDITALHLALYNKSGLVSYHGPVCASEFDSLTIRSFEQVLSENTKNIEGETSPPVMYSNSDVDVVTKGVAEGHLTGGNLTMVCATMGTPYEIDTKGAVLFLEDIAEDPYKIDRMLTQLWLAGKLEECAGFVFGIFKDCEPYKRNSQTIETVPIALWDVIQNRIEPLGKPCVVGMPFGHIKTKLTFPLGVKVKFDATNGSITLLEPSVV